MPYDTLFPSQPYFLSGFAGHIPGSATIVGVNFPRITNQWLSTKKFPNATEDSNFTVRGKISGFAGHLPRRYSYYGLSFPIDMKLAQTEFETLTNACPTYEAFKDKFDKEYGYAQKHNEQFQEVPGGKEKFEKMYEKMYGQHELTPPVRNAGPVKKPRVDYRRMRPYEEGIKYCFAGHIPGEKFTVGVSSNVASKNVRNILRGMAV